MARPRTQEEVNERIERVRRRRPRLLEQVVTLAHGAGGKSSAALTANVFLEAFGNPALDALGDAAVLDLPDGQRLAFSTDSYVVNPIQFPGGSIGDLAVNGTINDLAVSGAIPQWISAGFVIEEGLPMETLRALVQDMANAAVAAGVQIVTGDTKVVAKGAADQVFINTAGIGLVPAGRRLSSALVRPGDRIVLSGPMGAHGMAVMLARGDLDIEADFVSDTRAVNGLVEAVLAAAPDTRWLRDATRGGVGTVVNELAADTDLGVVLDEDTLPVESAVGGACELLGIDPLYVANEGAFVAVVPEAQAPAAVTALRSLPGGEQACVIGVVADDPPGLVVMQTRFGGTRVVDMLVGDPLPRIC
ncbi:hydrogenase expression/formation protein HypE [Kineosphaera limosa]|uniref:Hydrogenase maturation protein HypE n=1 Tax=Kineosphaera limosa NBRC 100340 TaxID=1184609 RepID=K6VPI1_9MICO|nr:hydrogenase expression/formation protein HypE [Kineosphaera limosa]NYE00213.1 hydrogenase expression/formation protein HypE [Kineosphaera limosa]GAB98128.1 hydrogenase maturation protein HypE [Kineosphaera limosa NBRC 100340]